MNIRYPIYEGVYRILTVVPVCILSMHRKMMMTSAENYSENERKTVVAGEVKVQSVHRHNGARFGCKSAESAGIFV